MFVNNKAGVRPLPLSGSDFRRVFRWRYLPRSSFVVPNVDGRYALGDQAVLALMPNPFPLVEQMLQCLLILARTC
jgi:hypothetical protein